MFLPVGFGPETLLVRQRVVDHCVSGSKAALGFNFADLATVSSTSTASSEDAPTTFASITSPSSLIEMFTISCALILSCELSPVLLFDRCGADAISRGLSHGESSCLSPPMAEGDNECRQEYPRAG